MPIFSNSIYDVIEELSKLVTYYPFISKVLNGGSGWDPLRHLILHGNEEQFRVLQQAITEEINGCPKPVFYDVPAWGHYIIYNSLLNKLLTYIRNIIEHHSVFRKKIEQNMVSFDAENFIFQQTENRFHGTIMLPINQALDPRLTGGACFGFFIQWAIGILKNLRAFGVQCDAPAPFEWINYQSRTGRKHPDLNHLAIFTAQIALYQEYSITRFPLRKLMSRQIGCKDILITTTNFLNDYNSNNETKLIKSFTDIAQDLISTAVETPQRVCELLLTTGDRSKEGHCMGFCKLKNSYHFLDANVGWFRFDRACDFVAWFPFFICTINSMRNNAYKFSDYCLFTYSKVVERAIQPQAGADPLSFMKSLQNHFMYTKRTIVADSHLPLPEKVGAKRVPNKSLEPLDLAFFPRKLQLPQSNCGIRMQLNLQ